MDWKNVLTKTLEVASAAANVYQFQMLIKMDREAACEHIKTIVKTYSQHNLDEYESNFLKFASTLFNHQQRIRALELYAFLKVVETLHYDQFRGFGTPGHALSS